MVAIRKHIDTLYRGMSYFFAFSIAFPNNLSVWVFTLWGFLFLGRKIDDSIAHRRLLFTPKERRFLPCLLLVVLFLFGVLSALWADESRLVFQRAFGPKLSLLILPLFALLDDESVDFSAMLRFFILGNMVFIAYSFLVVSYKYWIGEDIELHRHLLRYFTEVCNLILHRTYSGVNILLSYAAIFYLAGKERVTKRSVVMAVSYLLFSLLFLLLNNSRIITMAAVLLWMGFAFSWLMRGNRRVVLILLGALLLLGSAFAVLPSRTKDMVKNGEFTESLKRDPRAQIWPAAYDLGCEKPLVGYGLNNVTGKLVEKYLSADFLEGAAQQYGPHNEYLNHWLQTGVFGLLLLVALLVAIPWSASCDKRTFALPFSLVFAFVFLTESVLDRYNGCVTFAFFVWLLSHRGVDENRENRGGKALFAFLLTLMLVPLAGFAYTASVDRMHCPSKKFVRRDLFPGEDLFHVTHRDVQSFMHEGRCKSYFPIAFCELPTHAVDTFKIDCLVSEECDASTVKIIAEEDMPDGSVRPTESLYDLGRKESWQELAVEVKGKRTIIVYIFGDAKLSFDDIKGDVFFMNPRFETN